MRNTYDICTVPFFAPGCFGLLMRNMKNTACFPSLASSFCTKNVKCRYRYSLPFANTFFMFCFLRADKGALFQPHNHVSLPTSNQTVTKRYQRMTVRKWESAYPVMGRSLRHDRTSARLCVSLIPYVSTSDYVGQAGAPKFLSTKPENRFFVSKMCASS